MRRSGHEVTSAVSCADSEACLSAAAFASAAFLAAAALALAASVSDLIFASYAAAVPPNSFIAFWRAIYASYCSGVPPNAEIAFARASAAALSAAAWASMSASSLAFAAAACLSASAASSACFLAELYASIYALYFQPSSISLSPLSPKLDCQKSSYVWPLCFINMSSRSAYPTDRASSSSLFMMYSCFDKGGRVISTSMLTQRIE